MRNITIIMKKGGKILMSVGVFLGKFYFMTGVTLKLYQKSDSWPKDNLFSTFSRKYFTKKSKLDNLRHILTCFITAKIFFLKKYEVFKISLFWFETTWSIKYYITW